MLLQELQAKRGFIHELGKRYGVARIRVFGSVAREAERPDSDVDFLVDLPIGYDLLRQRLPMTEALSDLLRRRVDLIPEHELNPNLREQILREAVEL